MKKSIIIMLIVSLLFSSCYSYKTVDKNNYLAIGIKHKIKQTNKFEKVRLLAVTDSTITVMNKNKEQVVIAKSDIIKIKKRRFSYTKTALLPVGVAAVGITVALAIGGGGNFGPDFSK